MTKLKLLLNALTKFFVGFILISLLLFLPAGTFNYKNAWLFIALLFLPMFILGILLFIKSPELLEKRLDVKEKEKLLTERLTELTEHHRSHCFNYFFLLYRFQ